jgi:hypothetical protein
MPHRLHVGLTTLLLCCLPLSAQAENNIPQKERLTLEVGQSAVIYGHRGDCGQLPTADQIELPTLKTGTLSVGQEGQRESRRCGGITPAVEIIFTATTPGRERFEIDGDDFSVRVK